MSHKFQDYESSDYGTRYKNGRKVSRKSKKKTVKV